MSLERRVLLLSLGAGLPGSLIALILLWGGDHAPKVVWTLTPMIVGTWVALAVSARDRVAMTLRTVANLLEALREGDYSIRARRPHAGDAVGEVYLEVNALGDVLQRQRFHAVDAATLLQRVIQEIDVAIFTFDEHDRLQLVNRAGERMMARERTDLLDHSAATLRLTDCLEGELRRTFERSFPGRSGRWQSQRSSFREGGHPRRLLVLTDLSKALRDEERQAWQRLIRVMGHELNNSLAPIMSTASTLAGVLRDPDPHEDWRDDAQRGMKMIAARCASLNRFVSAYTRLARLPAPRRRATELGPLVQRVARLESRLSVDVSPGPLVALSIDPDQIEQLLINLIKNAVDATLEETPNVDEGVSISWTGSDERIEIEVTDHGPGIANTANLFVPFFTTKPGGTGIGLVLCRQIAEAHGGSLTLANRTHGGCVAVLRLPVSE